MLHPAFERQVLVVGGGMERVGPALDAADMRRIGILAGGDDAIQLRSAAQPGLQFGLLRRRGQAGEAQHQTQRQRPGAGLRQGPMLL